jgi:predicted transcriptional regulator
LPKLPAPRGTNGVNKFLKMSKKGKPTSAELEILDVLWERGTATVREIFEVLSARSKPTGYTTVLKLLQIMDAKGLVERDKQLKAHVYRARASQDETQKNLVSDLLEKAFRGSALKLVQHVLETKPASAEELTEIRKLIAEAEKKGESK